MAKGVRAGMVGCGSVAQRGILPHLSQDDARERLQLVAVVDAVEERARRSAAQFGVAAHFTEVQAMLESVDLDLVLVASPIPQHFAHAMAAIAAGKHVYVQKAMTTSLEEANALLAARDRAGVLLAAAPGFELCTTTGAMRRAVIEERLGRIYIAYTYTLGFGHEREPIRQGEGALAAIDPSWYYRRGAGPVPDVTVYALQLITSILGPVRHVTALANRGAMARDWRGQAIEVEVEDNNLLALEFASGTLAVAVGANCWGSARNPWGGLGLYGTMGRLEVTEVEMNSGYPVAYDLQTAQTGAQSITFTTSLAEQPYLRGPHLHIEEPHIYVDIMDLVDAIGEARPPRATGEQARHVVEIIERARVAAQTGQTQTMVTDFAPPDPVA